MRTELSCRHGKLHPRQRARIEDRIERLWGMFDRVVSVSATLDIRHDGTIVQMVTSVPRTQLSAHGAGDGPEDAVECAVRRIEHQLRRFTDRLHDYRSTIATQRALDMVDA